MIVYEILHFNILYIITYECQQFKYLSKLCNTLNIKNNWVWKQTVQKIKNDWVWRPTLNELKIIVYERQLFNILYIIVYECQQFKY